MDSITIQCTMIGNIIAVWLTNLVPKTTKVSSSPTANQEKNYLAFHHKEILNTAEGLYDQLLKVAVNNTIYPLSSAQ